MLNRDPVVQELSRRRVAERGMAATPIVQQRFMVSPGSEDLGGKVLSAHSRKTNNRVTAHLRLAVSVGRTSTALGAFYRRFGTDR